MGLVIAMSVLFALIVAVALVPIVAVTHESTGSRRHGGSMAEE